MLGAFAGGSKDIAPPAVLEDPFAQRGLPLRAFRRNLALQSERRRIHFVHTDAEHDGFGGVEIFVVVNARAGPLDPLVLRAEVGLDGAALDLIARGILPAVGRRHVIVIEDEQSRAEDRARQQYRRGEAIQAHSRGLERGHLVVSLYRLTAPVLLASAILS